MRILRASGLEAGPRSVVAGADGAACSEWLTSADRGGGGGGEGTDDGVLGEGMKEGTEWPGLTGEAAARSLAT